MLSSTRETSKQSRRPASPPLMCNWCQFLTSVVNIIQLFADSGVPVRFMVVRLPNLLNAARLRSLCHFIAVTVTTVRDNYTSRFSVYSVIIM